MCRGNQAIGQHFGGHVVRGGLMHGVQFHPESIATEHGRAMLANFLRPAGIEAKALA